MANMPFYPDPLTIATHVDFREENRRGVIPAFHPILLHLGLLMAAICPAALPFIRHITEDLLLHRVFFTGSGSYLSYR